MNYCRKMDTTSARGFLLLRLAVLIFVIGVIAAGIATFRITGWPLTKALLGNPHPTSLQNTPNAVDSSILSPEFIVAESLTSDYADLEKQLFIPLRNFYATRNEHLRQVMVESVPSKEHTAAVTLVVIENDEEKKVTFFFDRAGEEQEGPYHTWTLSDLDNT